MALKILASTVARSIRVQLFEQNCATVSKIWFTDKTKLTKFDFAHFGWMYKERMFGQAQTVLSTHLEIFNSYI